MTEEEQEKLSLLIKASQELVDAIRFDDCGMMIGGHWQGGNGGMLSRNTMIKADNVIRVLQFFKIGDVNESSR